MRSERRKLYENRPPEGAKPAWGGAKRKASGRLFGERAQLGRQGRSEAVFGRLWGRSWDAFGALGGASQAAPGRLLGGSFGRSGRCLWRYVKYSKNLVFCNVLGLSELLGEVRNRSKIGAGGLLDVSWDQTSVWRAQVEVHKAKLSYIGRFWTPCRSTKRLRNSAQLAQRKSRQAKIPSNCSYMD